MKRSQTCFFNPNNPKARGATSWLAQGAAQRQAKRPARPPGTPGAASRSQSWGRACAPPPGSPPATAWREVMSRGRRRGGGLGAAARAPHPSPSLPASSTSPIQRQLPPAHLPSGARTASALPLMYETAGGVGWGGVGRGGQQSLRPGVGNDTRGSERPCHRRRRGSRRRRRAAGGRRRRGRTDLQPDQGGLEAGAQRRGGHLPPHVLRIRGREWGEEGGWVAAQGGMGAARRRRLDARQHNILPRSRRPLSWSGTAAVGSSRKRQQQRQQRTWGSSRKRQQQRQQRTWGSSQKRQQQRQQHDMLGFSGLNP